MKEHGWLNATTLAYGSIALFMNVIHNVFLIYHVQAYTRVFGITQQGFWIAELVFMLGNSLNDLLWGMLSDGTLVSDAASDVASRNPLTTLNRRLRTIRQAGVGMSVFFLCMWFPLSASLVSVSFAVYLLLYDSFLSLVDVHYSALLADLTLSSATRGNMNMARSAASIIGSLSVLVSYLFWDIHDLSSFRMFAAVISCVSAIGFVATTHYLQRRLGWDGEAGDGSVRQALLPMHRAPSPKNSRTPIDQTGRLSLLASLRQLPSTAKVAWGILTHRNFFWFSLLHLVQVFHCHFNNNFFPAFLSILVGSVLSPTAQSLVLGLSFALPHINNIIFSHMTKTKGTYAVIRLLLLLKLGVAATTFITSRNALWLILFVASNRIFTEGTCKLMGLVVSDLTDEDVVISQRKQPLSALVSGLANFVAKPGQSFAPVVGTWILATAAPNFVFNSDMQQNDLSKSTKGYEAAREALFYMLTLVPMACGVLQLVFWSRFTLHGAKLQRVKDHANKLIHSNEDEPISLTADYGHGNIKLL
eukprot:m.198172 g.198172  ORF g.198172 m.198172 type:complete len:531 (-) comp14916_c1_seq1:109-1701(-)